MIGLAVKYKVTPQFIILQLIVLFNIRKLLKLKNDDNDYPSDPEPPTKKRRKANQPAHLVIKAEEKAPKVKHLTLLISLRFRTY